MSKFVKLTFYNSFGLFSFIIIFVSDEIFKIFQLFDNLSVEYNVIFNKIIVFIIIFLLCYLYGVLKSTYVIKENNYTIVVKYADIFSIKNCLKVIPFDECFSTKIGTEKGDIKEKSICGQYLKKYPDIDIKKLIKTYKIRDIGKSEYRNKNKYEPGTLIKNNDFFLMAFVKLDKNGIGKMSRDDFLKCLDVLWKEINELYCQHDICIPILGSGITRFEDESLGHQELLDIIIASYKLSNKKIKTPNKLYIVCRKKDGVLLNKIGQYI